MNARAMEPLAVDFIFGDHNLHARFSIAIELMARLVIANPRPLTSASLSENLGQPLRVVRGLLAALHESGLVSRHAGARDTWVCPPLPGSLTLADVFRCVAESGHGRKKKTETVQEEERSAAQQSVDLLLMQATMAINQVVLQHLQTFDLGRLKALGGSGAFHAFATGRHARAYIAEPV